MRIAIFSDTFPPQVNGVAKAASLMAETLKAHGHEVQVFCSTDSTSIPFWGYPGERIVIPVGTLVKKAKLFKPDIIHTHTPFGVGWEAVRLARALKVPLVGTHHTFFDHYLDHVHLNFNLVKTISWKYVAGYYNKCDLVISPSKALLDGMKENGVYKKLILFPNAVDIGAFLPVQENRRQELKKKFGIKGVSLVYMGRLSYEKSVEVVIQAYKKIVEKHPESTLLVVGNGPQKNKLEKMVEELSLKKNVLFTGMLVGNDLVEAIQANDFFVTASKTENMPLSVMEAMSAGLPVIGVDSLGMPEIVKDNENGFIVSPDHVDEFANRMDTLFKDANLRQKFAEGARKTAQSYDKDENIKKLVHVYESLIQKKF
jgi:1,2-diacylglycerol 3-alpha-glucosyltransferase